MIRSKADLLAVLKYSPDRRLFGNSKNRPSAPWTYTVSIGDDSHTVELVVHGSAVNAAIKTGEIKQVRGSWNYSVHRAA
jgi:hypothetical protein